MSDGSTELLDNSTQVSFTGCMHDQRMSLLTWTVEWSLSAIALHIKLYSSHETILSVLAQRGLPQSLRDQAESTALPGTEDFRNVKMCLHRATWTCVHCIDANRRLAEECHLKEDSGLVINRPNQRMGGSGEGEEEFQERELEDPIEGEEEEGMSYQRELLQLARRTGGKLVTGLKDATRKSKPVQPYSFREERPVAVVKEFNPEFDSYKTGPTVEMLVEAHRELCLAFHFDPPIARWSTIGDRFRDHGYRRTEGGFHQFFLNNPSPDEQLEHFFPLPPKGVLDEWRKRKEAANVEAQEVAEGDWVGHRLPEAAITGNDLEAWTVKKMVGPAAGEEGTEKGMMTYITGKTSSGKHIRLDINKSRKVVENLHFSADIDSVLWITDTLKVLGSINLHIMPFKGERAPIKTHNHAYVNLCLPRTNAESGRGQRSGASQEVPLSNLPNTHFAHFGRTLGSAEVYVVFPRMKHKYPLRKGSETKVPSEVETFWLENVVYKAVKGLKQMGIKPYTDWVLEDTVFKHGGLQDHAILVSPEHLDKILEGIRGILKENEEDESYSRFGSLFFVLQIMGIKVSTSLDEDWGGLWKKLVMQHPSLDWKHMEDTENGELLVDLGFGIHPLGETHVVGFWDVDAIRQSFDYGGYGNGTTHGVFTVPCIGATHAEMTSRRKKRTHLAYRLTYNLHFEVVRSHKNSLKQGFFPPAHAYNQSKQYKETVLGVVDAYERSKCKSFGVRDEYRCRASSMERLLPCLKAKVRGLPPTASSSFDSGSKLPFYRPKNTSQSWIPSSGSPLQTGLALCRGDSRRSATSRPSFTGSRLQQRTTEF
jgi:hypothetical protein